MRSQRQRKAHPEGPTGPASQRRGRANSSRVGPTPAIGGRGILTLQRAAGNRVARLAHRLVVPTRLVQRLDDEEGKEITQARVDAEVDIEKLKGWKARAEEHGSWDDDVDAEYIGKRIAALEAEASRAAEEARIKSSLEKAVGGEGSLPNFDYGVQQRIQTNTRADQAKFFAICHRDNVDPGIVLTAIERAATSPVAKKRAVTAFAAEAPLATALRLAAEYDHLHGLTRDTVAGTDIAKLVTEGWLDVARRTYADNPRVAGSVYTFEIALLGEQLNPEWHVHWGSRNTILSSSGGKSLASFKNKSDARKIGEGVRRYTSRSENQALQGAIKAKNLWGT